MARRTIKQIETQYAQQQQAILQENGALTERLAALEMALESADWRRLTMDAEQEFTREGLRAIVELARIMALKNPLVKRGVEVQRLYVWGQGWSVKAVDEKINETIQAFLNDPKNQPELSHQARGQKESELQTDGNLFLALFPNTVTGKVRVRSIPFEEIEEVITNPEDRAEPWFYKRVWTSTTTTLATGATETRQAQAYYPDWRYNPTVKPATIGTIPIRWNSPLCHIRGNAGYSSWSFGCSEIYASIDWAKAYKEFLEDWASIVRAYRRFAFQLSTPGGKQGIAAAKTKLGSTYATGSEGNPPPAVGSTFITGGEAQLTPIRTSGATVSADDGRRMLLMVSAAVGLPETFFGDVSVGTLATATSLDRPTELAMRDRQTLWMDVYGALFEYVTRWAVKATRGALRGLGTVVTEIEDGQITERVEWNSDVKPTIDIDFPPIVSGDFAARVAAIKEATTLGGQPLAGTLDLPTVARLMLSALGEDDIDSTLERLFPAGEGEAPPSLLDQTQQAQQAQAQVQADQQKSQQQTQAEAAMVEAFKEARAALVRMREGGK